MRLPDPKTDGQVSLEKTIKSRRTVRSFSSTALTLEQLSQPLWSAQGITRGRGPLRAAASAGATYPMDVYAVIGEGGVEELQAGIYHYEPEGHSVSLIADGDFRNPLAAASLSQRWMARAPANLVITAEYSRIRGRYGERGVRYALTEAGHIGQNIFLQAEALGLGSGIVGAFHDLDVVHALHLPSSHEPILVMPVGYKS